MVVAVARHVVVVVIESVAIVGMVVVSVDVADAVKIARTMASDDEDDDCKS